MGRRAFIAIAVLAACSTLASAAEVIDRIVATVDRRAVLQSELYEAIAFECLQAGRPLRDVSSDERKQTLERLIDQELVAAQMRASSFVPATPEEIAGRVRELRDSVAAWKSDSGWHAALDAYGLSEDDVKERTAVQVNLLRYLDLRFRPQVHVDERAIENYYRSHLVPQVRQSGSPAPPLNQVSSRIEQLLVEQRMNELQDRWVRSLREQAEIQVR
jgi:hypothetical protein